MASFIFEEGTQAQASAFLAGEQLIFKTATPTTLGVVYTPAANATSVNTITLSLGTFSLTFAAASLANNTNLNFLSGGTLRIGDQTAGDTITLSSDTASAAYGLGGGDTIAALSGKGAHVVDMGAGDDSVSVAAGAATALTGNYVISGGDGNDVIDARSATGNLHIYGNAFGSVAGAADGNDTITVGHGTAAGFTSYVNGNAGNDSITIAGAATVSGDTYRLQGGGGNDTISVANEGANSYSFVNGNAGNDTITGGAGTDVLRGGQGDDVITAGGGNATLMGDVGNDTINAGAGINVISGGTGNDVFVFGVNTAGSTHILPTTPSTDTLIGYTTSITDFATGGDKIDLANVNLAGGATVAASILTQAAGTTFAAGAQSAALVYAQQLLDNAGADTATKHSIAAIQVGGDTYLFSHESTAGNGTIDTAIKLNGVTAANLKSADFI